MALRPTEIDELELSAYLDDELSSSERALIEAALRESAELRARLDDLRTVAQGLRGLPREILPREVADKIRASLGRGAITGVGRAAPHLRTISRIVQYSGFAACLLIAAMGGWWAGRWSTPVAAVGSSQLAREVKTETTSPEPDARREVADPPNIAIALPPAVSDSAADAGGPPGGASNAANSGTPAIAFEAEVSPDRRTGTRVGAALRAEPDESSALPTLEIVVAPSNRRSQIEALSVANSVLATAEFAPDQPAQPAANTMALIVPGATGEATSEIETNSRTASALLSQLEAALPNRVRFAIAGDASARDTIHDLAMRLRDDATSRDRMRAFAEGSPLNADSDGLGAEAFASRYFARQKERTTPDRSEPAGISQAGGTGGRDHEVRVEPQRPASPPAAPMGAASSRTSAPPTGPIRRHRDGSIDWSEPRIRRLADRAKIEESEAKRILEDLLAESPETDAPAQPAAVPTSASSDEPRDKGGMGRTAAAPAETEGGEPSGAPHAAAATSPANAVLQDAALHRLTKQAAGAAPAPTSMPASPIRLKLRIMPAASDAPASRSSSR